MSSGGNESSRILPSWTRTYARDHTIHLLVVLFLIVYPGIYSFIAGADFVTVGKLLFPNMATMRDVLFVALFAMSFDFISGYTGYLSFGHSLFFGTGVFFVMGVKNNSFSGVPLLGSLGPETSLMVLILLGALIAALLALLLGAVSFRLTGVYFAMITLGFAELAKFTAEGYFGTEGIQYPANLTPEIGIPFVDGLSLPVGAYALSGQGAGINLGHVNIFAPVLMVLDRIPGIGSVVDPVNQGLYLETIFRVFTNVPFLGKYVVTNPTLSGNVLTYYVVGVIVLISYLAMQRMIHSPFGRVMIAIRENEERAEAIGYNTFRYKMGAFAISAFFGSVAGSLRAAATYTGSPAQDFGVIDRAGEALLATIIGGIGTLAGPFYGFLFDKNLREFFGDINAREALKPFMEDNLQWLLNIHLPKTSVGEIVDIWLAGRGSLYIGLVFIAFILFVPGGLLGTVRVAVDGKVAKVFPDWVGRRVASVRTRIDDLR